ncbi:MAG: hypothetical protein PUD34_02780 [bacterium]|nr:hypothetical protein [bacterium]
MDNNKFCVDEIIDDIIKLENLTTREIIYINLSELDFCVVDGDILYYKDDKYYKDDNAKKERIKMLQEKLDRLKKAQF